MSDKHYVGLDIMDFENTGRHKPISRVTLYIDDEQYYTAGDDTGKEISSFCPSATQEMADTLLAQLQGYEYQSYTAGDANIDPAAELGDGVTVGGIYSVISQIEDDGSGYAGIAAPGEAELEEEYPYVGPLEREFNRKMYKAYSLIEKNNERITLEVGELRTYTDGALEELAEDFGVSLESLEGDIYAELENYSTIEITDASIEFAVSQSKTYTDSKTGEVVASLKNYSTIEQTNSSISAAVTSVKEYTNSSVNSLGSSIDTKLENYSTIEMTDASIEFAVSQSKIYTDSKTGEITSSLSEYSTIEQTASSISSAVAESKQYTDGRYETLNSTITQTATELTSQINGVDDKYSTVKQTVDGLTIETVNGKTVIDGGNIRTSNLVLTGRITWSDLDSGVQTNINNRGISAAQATTLITSTLVSSPNIAGGKFWDLDQTTWIEIGDLSDDLSQWGVRLRSEKSQLMQDVWAAYDGDLDFTALYGKVGFCYLILEGGSQKAMPYGTWDFSNATVTGLTAKFG